MCKSTCNLKSQRHFVHPLICPVLCCESARQRRPCPNHCNYLCYLKEKAGAFLLLKQPFCMSRYKKQSTGSEQAQLLVLRSKRFNMPNETRRAALFVSVCVCDSEQRNTIKVHYDWNSKWYLLNINVLWRGNMTQIKFY